MGNQIRLASQRKKTQKFQPVTKSPSETPDGRPNPAFGSVLHLQRTIGNRAVHSLLGFDPALRSKRRGGRANENYRFLQKKDDQDLTIQRRLNITGTQGDVDEYLESLERVSGYDLTWTAPGPRVTIAGNNPVGTRSPTGRTRLRQIVRDTAQHAQLTIGTHQHRVGIGAWPGPAGGVQTIDIDDIRNLNAALPGHGDAKAYHEMVENYDANSAATQALPAASRFRASHARGVEAESDVLEESTIRGRRLGGGVPMAPIPAPAGQPTGPNITYLRSIQHFTHYNLEMIYRRTIAGGTADFEVVTARRIPKREISQRVFSGFVSGSPAIPGGAAATLAATLADLNADPARTLLIETYTDSSGRAASNLAMSRRRANSVRAWFTGNGINQRRIAVVGRGETNFVASNATPAGRRRNRRAVLTVHGT